MQCGGLSGQVEVSGSKGHQGRQVHQGRQAKQLRPPKQLLRPRLHRLNAHKLRLLHQLTVNAGAGTTGPTGPTTRGASGLRAERKISMSYGFCIAYKLDALAARVKKRVARAV